MVDREQVRREAGRWLASQLLGQQGCKSEWLGVSYDAGSVTAAWRCRHPSELGHRKTEVRRRRLGITGSSAASMGRSRAR